MRVVFTGDFIIYAHGIVCRAVRMCEYFNKTQGYIVVIICEWWLIIIILVYSMGGPGYGIISLHGKALLP